MTSGITRGGWAAPTVEIELQRRRPGHWRVLRSDVKMPVLRSI